MSKLFYVKRALNQRQFYIVNFNPTLPSNVLSETGIDRSKKLNEVEGRGVLI